MFILLINYISLYVARAGVHYIKHLNLPTTNIGRREVCNEGAVEFVIQ